MSKRDFWSAVATGLTTGIIAWRLALYLKGFSFPWLALLVPVLWVAGVNLGYFLGQWLKPFNQFGKFAAIGFTNAAVDFGVFYLLLSSSGADPEGLAPNLFKVVSFFLATVHSFMWNKYWAFEASKSRGGAKEAGQFTAVALVSLAVNAIVFALVKAVPPLFGLDIKLWLGLALVAGSAAALIFSFAGFKLFVFRK